MSEEVSIILIMLFWALVIYTFYLNFWVIRRLRKKLDRIVDAAVMPRPAAEHILVAPQADSAEMRRVEDRLRVLERIAVEKETSLSREIDGLRASNG